MKFARADYNKRIIDKENKIPTDEPVFLLRAQDQLAPDILFEWAKRLLEAGGDLETAKQAIDQGRNMQIWQKSHKVKTPDMYKESESKQFILQSIREELSKPDFNISKINNLVEKYYDGRTNLVKILMPVDFKSEVMTVFNINNLEYKDFNISDDEAIEMVNSKLIIFCSSKGNKILKNKIYE